MEIHQRLAEFFRRLEAAPAVSDAAEALTLVCRVMEQVEDGLCSLPREESPSLRFTGRMYAPREDRVFPQPDGSLIAEARHHRITCFPDGAIRIVYKPGNAVLLNKRGKIA